VQTAWVKDNFLYVLKDGQVAKVVWGSNKWDGKLSGWGDLLRGGVQAAFVHNDKFYVIRGGKATTLNWGDRHTWSGTFESWGPILQGSVEAAWVADGNLYVVKDGALAVKVFGMEYGWDGSFMDFAPIFHKVDRPSAAPRTDQFGVSSAALPTDKAQSMNRLARTAPSRDSSTATPSRAQEFKFLGSVSDNTPSSSNVGATFSTGLAQDPQGRTRESTQDIILILIGVGVGICCTAICGFTSWWLCRPREKAYDPLEEVSEGLNAQAARATQNFPVGKNFAGDSKKAARATQNFPVGKNFAGDSKKASRKVAFTLPTPARSQR